MNRRFFHQRSAAFAGCSAAGLTGCVKRPVAASLPGAPSLPFYDAVGPITPIRADVDRIFRITFACGLFVPRDRGSTWNHYGLAYREWHA